MPYQSQLGRFLVSQEIGGLLFMPDVEYCCPSERWVRDSFVPNFEAFKRSISRGVNLAWKGEVFDCDDFARLAADYAELLHNGTKKKPAGALAFGEFWYDSSRGYGHAINLAIVANSDNRPKLLFFEPQTCEILNLNQEEIESCYVARF